MGTIATVEHTCSNQDNARKNRSLLPGNLNTLASSVRDEGVDPNERVEGVD